MYRSILKLNVNNVKLTSKVCSLLQLESLPNPTFEDEQEIASLVNDLTKANIIDEDGQFSDPSLVTGDAAVICAWLRDNV